MRKNGFAPAAFLVLLFLVVVLGFAVTRVTDLKNVFQKPKAAGNESNSRINRPEIYPSPVVRWGNSSYHDSLGVRDPWAVKDGGTTYLLDYDTLYREFFCLV